MTTNDINTAFTAGEIGLGMSPYSEENMDLVKAKLAALGTDAKELTKSPTISERMATMKAKIPAMPRPDKAIASSWDAHRNGDGLRKTALIGKRVQKLDAQKLDILSTVGTRQTTLRLVTKEDGTKTMVEEKGPYIVASDKQRAKDLAAIDRKISAYAVLGLVAVAGSAIAAKGRSLKDSAVAGAKALGNRVSKTAKAHPKAASVAKKVLIVIAALAVLAGIGAALYFGGAALVAAVGAKALLDGLMIAGSIASFAVIPLAYAVYKLNAKVNALEAERKESAPITDADDFDASSTVTASDLGSDDDLDIVTDDDLDAAPGELRKDAPTTATDTTVRHAVELPAVAMSETSDDADDEDKVEAEKPAETSTLASVLGSVASLLA